MMVSKQGVFERIGQSWEIFKTHFFVLCAPILVYKLIVMVLTGVSMYEISLKGLNISTQSSDLFTLLNDPFVVIGITVAMVGIIVYLSAFVVMTLMLILSVKQAYNGEKVSVGSNFVYGIKNFFPSMQTYWFIFSYVVLTPAILFMIGGILFDASFFLPSVGTLLKEIGGIIMGVAGIVLIVFVIHRGIKSIFALYSAVEYDSFTKQNFKKSVKLSDGQWLRIVGNILLLSIFLALLSGLVSIFIPTGFDIMSIHSLEDIKNIFNHFSFSAYIIGDFFKTLFNAITSVFTVIFLCIFFKRLEQESSENI